MSLNFNLKEEEITCFRFFLHCFGFHFFVYIHAMELCLMAQSAAAWENFLGKYHFMIHHPLMTQGVELCGCYKQPSQPLV